MATTIVVALQLVRSGRPSGVDRVLPPVVVAFLAMNRTGGASPSSRTPSRRPLAFGTVMAVTMTAEFLFLVREGLVPHGTGASPAPMAPAAAPTSAGGARPAAPARP